MKIAFIGHKGYPSLYGGVEKVVEEIANRLADRGHKCIVYSRKYYSKPDYDNSKVERIIVKGLKTRRLDTLSHTFISLIDVLRRDVDVIAIHSFGNAILNFMPKLKGIPVALHLHGFEWGQTRFNFIERNLLLRLPFITLKRFSDVITSVSIAQHKELNNRKIDNLYLPNGVDINMNTSNIRNYNGEKYILYVGRIAYQKGIDYLIRAFNLSGPDGFKLKIVGDHDHAEKYYNLLITLAENNPAIEFLGYKYGDELNNLYQHAYAVVIPSESEECPMVLLESLSFHKCVIASRIPGIYNIAGDNVIYFESKNAEQLAAKINEVCSSTLLKTEYENKLTYSDKLNQFRWDNIVEQYEKLYQNIFIKKFTEKKNEMNEVKISDINTSGADNFELKLKILNDLIQPFRTIHKVYYTAIRPYLPKNYRKQLQRIYKININFNRSYIDEQAAEVLKKSNGSVQSLFPENYKSAAVLTHDIDSAEGLKFVPQIIELSQSYNMRSCWYIVPYKYTIDEGIIRLIREAGDEIGIHGYNHDGLLFSSKKIFDKRKPFINDAIKRFGANGFRAPMVHRNISWINELNIKYDSSSFDYDPFQPFPGGTGMTLPFMYKNIVELPYTILQDHTLFYELRQKDISIWIKKINWLVKNNSMILSITHPDYLIPPDNFMMYKDLLEYLSLLENSWRCLPSEISDWWTKKTVQLVNKSAAGEKLTVY